MFATKLPCLLLARSPVLLALAASNARVCTEAARAVKPGCFVAPSIVRWRAMRRDAMRWPARCSAAVSGSPDESPSYNAAVCSMLSGMLAVGSLSSAQCSPSYDTQHLTRPC
jgi:hypothetical protein